MKNIVSLVIYIIFSSSTIDNCYSQIIYNPSLEGLDGWSSCNSYSTPDIQPGVWEVDLPPSNGSHYSSLVTRGVKNASNDNMTEDLQVKLAYPLRKNQPYNFSIDLAYSSKFYDGEKYHNNPVKIIIWGSTFGCIRTEILYESTAIDHEFWKTYNLTLLPTIDNYNYINIEAYYVSQPNYYGNVLLDNIIIEDYSPSALHIVVPNVITPNGDGKNDFLLINKLPPYSNLMIFNRWGKQVYQNLNYDNTWNGNDFNSTELVDGTYWFMLDIPYHGIEKGYVFILRN